MATIGVLGLGLIGGYAAETFLANGHRCLAVRRPSTEDFPARGGELVATPRELAAASEILVSALPGDDSIRSAMFGPDGVVAGAHDGLVIVEMNTAPVALKEELKAAIDRTPAIILDAPISGSRPMLAAGRGVIMTSGDAAAAERVRPVLELVAPKTMYVGAYGTGIKLKLVINFLVGANTVAIAEAMLFGHAMGLDSQTMLDVVGPSAGGSMGFNFRVPVIAARKWQPPSAPARLLYKDLKIIEAQVEALGLAAPAARLATGLYRQIEAAGRLEDDLSVVYEILEAQTKPA
ncbi:MAG: NAD(P)-dependent oxidoreductase [Alphaproteobacteria bacterium]|nr:NAD(P)-dependent oxidoreductase [Alphaproteobacteria bacterium]